MSRAAGEHGDDTEDIVDDEKPQTDEEPEIVEDLFEEELRIDGICGVY